MKFGMDRDIETTLTKVNIEEAAFAGWITAKFYCFQSSLFPSQKT